MKRVEQDLIHNDGESLPGEASYGPLSGVSAPSLGFIRALICIPCPPSVSWPQSGCRTQSVTTSPRRQVGCKKDLSLKPKQLGILTMSRHHLLGLPHVCNGLHVREPPRKASFPGPQRFWALARPMICRGTLREGVPLTCCQPISRLPSCIVAELWTLGKPLQRTGQQCSLPEQLRTGSMSP